jgi:hypothetical protein
MTPLAEIGYKYPPLFVMQKIFTNAARAASFTTLCGRRVTEAGVAGGVTDVDDAEAEDPFVVREHRSKGSSVQASLCLLREIILPALATMSKQHSSAVPQNRSASIAQTGYNQHVLMEQERAGGRAQK